MISPDELKTLIQTALPEALVEVQDLTGGGDHYQAVVVSELFEGKSLIKQHQLVYTAVQSAMATDQIHALALKTYTPQTWQALG
jgi:acid stress-induced BolA-like protein IbaG/YrbA